MGATARKSSEILRDGGFSIEIKLGELTVTRDRSAWNPRMYMLRDWQVAVAIMVVIFLVVELASNKSVSGPVPLVSFPILLGSYSSFFGHLE